MNNKLIEQLQRISLIEWTLESISDELIKLMSVKTREELWIYLVKKGKILQNGGFRYSVGKKWTKGEHYSTGGDYEEVVSAAMSHNADTVLLVHNHPNTDFIAHQPSDGDYTVAKNFDDILSQAGIKGRYFVVSSSGVIEFNGSGQIVAKSEGLRNDYVRYKYPNLPIISDKG